MRHAAGVVAGDAAVRSVVLRHVLFIFSVTYFFTVFSLYLRRELHVGPDVSSWLLAGAGAIGGVALCSSSGAWARASATSFVSEAGLLLLTLAYAALAYTRELWAFGAALGVWASARRAWSRR